MIEEFYKPTTVQEALEQKKKFGDQALYLGGGVEVNNLFFPNKPKHLISLEGLQLNQIVADQKHLVLGSGCTIQQILESDLVPDVLKKACLNLTNRNIRNQATIGGHIATNKSCSDLLPTLIVLGTELEITESAQTKTVLLEDYINSEGRDLITSVMIPQLSEQTKVSILNFTRSANDVSILTAAVSYVLEHDVLKNVKIAVGGVAKHVIRLSTVEKQLAEKTMPCREDVEAMVKEVVCPITDIRGTAEFKKYEIAVMVGGCFISSKLKAER
ncbi:MAG: hypothetical protein ACD_62C00482G0002 [uncultured bacterium]|nr:MAG: hypothetical protein ACD_62C00482G0002 [uncultured bacterium]HLD45481.1 FAD binding domain-containing protein [bacterium]